MLVPRQDASMETQVGNDGEGFWGYGVEVRVKMGVKHFFRSSGSL